MGIRARFEGERLAARWRGPDRRWWPRCGVALAVAASGCGGDDERAATSARPSRSTSRSASDEKSVTASPAKFGAGPITMLVANQSGASQTLTIDGPRLRRSVGPINPQDTATVKLRVEPGEYTVSAAESPGLREATLHGRAQARPAPRTRLLLP